MSTPCERLTEAFDESRYALEGKTPRATALELSWNENTFKSNLNGLAPYSFKMAKMYAMAFGVRAEWLYDGAGSKREILHYVPDEGHVVWIELRPTQGREQGGHRPAIVLTKARFNDRSHLMLCVPMTSRVKNYPFEVRVGDGVALIDQTRSVDWKERGVTKKGTATVSELEAVRDKLRKLIG